MPDRNERILNDIQHNKLSMDSKFQFSCKMCGSCCRKRKERIVITGLDIYRLAQALGVSTGEVLSKYTEVHLGSRSHLPLAYLRERLDGSCCLLRSGRCMVQNMKPIVCAVFPLGRGIDPQTNEIVYFAQDTHCGSNALDAQTWTLREWLAQWKITELDSMSLSWTRISMGLALVTTNMKPEHMSPSLVEELKDMLYIGYDPALPYEEQVEDIIKAHIPVLRSKFRLKIDQNSFVFQ